MSDADLRELERRWRSTGDQADGEAWVQAVLRTTGVNSTFLIARVIETQRALRSLIIEQTRRPDRPLTPAGALPDMADAFRQPVTPDDIVDFLRGGREWLKPPMFITPTELVADPNAHLPYQRGVPAGSAILCNHANENPGHCPCDADCYCRQDGRTCSDRRRCDVLDA